eukprot:1523798-Rhodomonas_salina.8
MISDAASARCAGNTGGSLGHAAAILEVEVQATLLTAMPGTAANVDRGITDKLGGRSGATIAPLLAHME